MLILAVMLGLAWLAVDIYLGGTESQLPDRLELVPEDRVLVLAPHPDDEVLATGGVIQDAVEIGASVRVVFLTYGDANQWSFALYRNTPATTPAQVIQMAEVRRREALAAGRVLGVQADEYFFLGYPDFDTLNIFYRHWGNASPGRGLLTRASSVPYASAFRRGAPYRGEEILSDLKQVLSQYRPTKIFVSHPSDTNPDHRAMYLFLRLALWDLEDELQPAVYPYLVHYPGWPLRKTYQPSSALTPPLDLRIQGEWLNYPLEPERVQAKLSALRKHRTQYQSNSANLLRYLRANELFGDFPIIRLGEGEMGALLSPAFNLEPQSEGVEQLTDEEQEAFIEVESLAIQLAEGNIRVMLRLDRPIERNHAVSIYLFGYRKDRPFAELPKIQLLLRQGNSLRMLDQSTILPAAEVEIEQMERMVTLAVPLDLLGSPERLLVTARSTYRNTPLSWAPWRVVEFIAGDPAESGE